MNKSHNQTQKEKPYSKSVWKVRQSDCRFLQQFFHEQRATNTTSNHRVDLKSLNPSMGLRTPNSFTHLSNPQDNVLVV
jgi:hypothetical protein